MDEVRKEEGERAETPAVRKQSCDCCDCFSRVEGTGHRASTVTRTQVIFSCCHGGGHKQQGAAMLAQKTSVPLRHHAANKLHSEASNLCTGAVVTRLDTPEKSPDTCTNTLHLSLSVR